MIGRTVAGRPVEQVLDAIPDFAGAGVVAQLSDGPTNASFLIEQAGVKYVLRLDKPEAISLGLNRSNEKRVCEVVADAGLAPRPLYFNLAEGVYLRHFVTGRSWDVADLSSPDRMVRLAHVLRTVHGLPLIGTAFDPLGAARRYVALLGGEQSRVILRKSEQLMLGIAAGSPGQALCHNDLVCQNVLEGERLMLIDWEYAGVGDPFFDLAVVVRHHDLDSHSALRFLDEYLQRSATSAEIEHLGLYCDFYSCLLDLWERVGRLGLDSG